MRSTICRLQVCIIFLILIDLKPRHLHQQLHIFTMQWMSPSCSRLQPVRTPWRCRTQSLHSSHHCSRSLRHSLPHKTRACLSEDKMCLTTCQEKYEISPLAFAVSVSFLPSASSVSGLERQPQLGMGRPSGPVGQGASRPGGPAAPWSPFRPRFPFLPASPWAHE